MAAAKVDPEQPALGRAKDEDRDGANPAEDDDGRTPLCGSCCTVKHPANGPLLLGVPTAVEETPEASRGRVAQAALITTLWWVAAVYVTLMFKLTTVALPPFTLTWLVNTATGLIALVLARVSEWDSPALPAMNREEVLQIGVLGAAQGCEFGCLNKSLQYLTVSERTMLQNINVLLMMATAWLCGLERLTGLRVVAGMLLASGGLLQGLDSSHEGGEGPKAAQTAHIRGVGFMLTSMLLTSGKWSLIQIITQRSSPTTALGRMSKLQLAARVQPFTGLVCLALAGLFERRALAWHHVLHSSSVLLRVPLIAGGITVIQCSELKLVQITSAVTCGVLMNLHHIPMVLGGVVFFHDTIDSLGLAGFASCILGGVFYASARYMDVKAEAPATSSPASPSPHRPHGPLTKLEGDSGEDRLPVVQERHSW